MIARVFGPILRATSSGSQWKVSGSMSTNTGFAPTRQIDPAVAKKV